MTNRKWGDAPWHVAKLDGWWVARARHRLFWRAFNAHAEAITYATARDAVAYLEKYGRR